MFSGMSAITFATSLVAALCVADVNAVVWETCRFTDHKCKNLIKGSCLAGLDQPELDNDADESYDYKSRQNGEDGYYGVAPKDYKTCEKFAEAAYKELTDDVDDADDYTEAGVIHRVEAVQCFSNDDDMPAPPKGEFYGIRCGDSSTGKIYVYVGIGVGGGVILVIAIFCLIFKYKCQHKSGSSYNINSGNDSDPDNGGINGDDATLLSFGNNPNSSNSTTSGGDNVYE